MADQKIENIQDVYNILDKSKSVNVIYEKFPFSHPVTTNGKVKNLQLGRLWFQLMLPQDFRIVDEPLDNKTGNKILSEIARSYPPDIAEKVTRQINEECLKMSSYYPASFTSDSLDIGDKIRKHKSEILNEDLPPDEFAKRQKQLGEEYIDRLGDINSGLYDISKAGASKSSPTDLAVFFIAKGPTAGFTGEVTKPILNNLNDGFTLDEYYKSAEQARFANYIRAVG